MVEDPGHLLLDRFFHFWSPGDAGSQVTPVSFDHPQINVGVRQLGSRQEDLFDGGLGDLDGDVLADLLELGELFGRDVSLGFVAAAEERFDLRAGEDCVEDEAADWTFHQGDLATAAEDAQRHVD
ncbi:hypothetical protein D3C84_874930 [compost metagenome]